MEKSVGKTSSDNNIQLYTMAHLLLLFCVAFFEPNRGLTSLSCYFDCAHCVSETATVISSFVLNDIAEGSIQQLRTIGKESRNLDAMWVNTADDILLKQNTL